MNRIVRLGAAALTAGVFLSLALSAAAAPKRPAAKPAPAAEPMPEPETPQAVIVGSTWLFNLRMPDKLNGQDWTVADRLNHIQDVLPKHLGGQYAKFDSKKWGQRVHLYLNNDFILAVTPWDARATGYKTAEQLAPIWLRKLKAGFDEAHVRQSVPVRRQ